MAMMENKALEEQLSGTLREIRSALGVTQRQFASALDISLRSLQSYEQGWRPVPVRLVKQGLVLLALKRERDGERQPCWDVRQCSPDDREDCPGYTMGDGRLCWFVVQEPCGPPETECELPCLDCPVVRCLLQGTSV